MSRVRYLVKSLLGREASDRIGRLRRRLRKLLSGPARDTPLSEQFPLSSPNTFRAVQACYLIRPSPSVFEYGSGASTLWHLRALIDQGGSITAVEHDAAWAERVSESVESMANQALAAGRVRGFEVRDRIGVGSSRFFEAAIHSLSGRDLIVRIICAKRDGWSGDRDGSAEDYRAYVRSLLEPVDVVIVDGRARKACVRHVLEHGLLRPGGALALFEAGRGVEGWLDAPALQGTSDYQPEVRTLLSRGAVLMDGTGYDTWPGLAQRREFSSFAFASPLELCLLRLAEGETLSDGGVTSRRTGPSMRSE